MGIFLPCVPKKPFVLKNCTLKIAGHTGKLDSVVKAMQLAKGH